MGLRRAVLACVYVLVLTATVGLVAAAAPAKGTSPTIGFTAPSPTAGASVPGGSISFALSVNRTPEQLKTLTCALAGPTASTGACSAAVASGTGSSSGITYANLAPGTYTLTVSLVTLKLSDGGSASASRKFTVSQPAPQVDLSVTKTNGATTAVPGASTTYTIVVTNGGPSGAVGATVADTLPTELTNATWTALGTSGTNGFPASGTGNISNTVNLPASASVTYTVTATLSALATGTLSNTATVTPAVGTTDTNTANNSAADIDTLTPAAPINGAAFIPDANRCAFPWSLFSFQPDAPDNLKALATLDADGMERQHLKFQINNVDVKYNLDFNGDGLTDTGGEYPLFHRYSSVLGQPVILDVLIAEALTSSDQLYDVLNIKSDVAGPQPFDPADPINTFFDLVEMVVTGTGSNVNGAVYVVGADGDNNTMIGGNFSDVVLGGGGNDSNAGNSCDDYVSGGAGIDQLKGNSGNDVVNGGSGDDIIDGAGGDDVLLGGTGADVILGSGQGDVLYGGIDHDRDTLTGGAMDADLVVFAVTTDASGQLVLLSDNDVITDIGASVDSLGFLDYSPTAVVANDDTNRDLILDNMVHLTGHVTISTGQFSGNTSLDTKLTFDGGGSLILESFNSPNFLNDLFNVGHIQAISATGLSRP